MKAQDIKLNIASKLLSTGEYNRRIEKEARYISAATKIYLNKGADEMRIISPHKPQKQTR